MDNLKSKLLEICFNNQNRIADIAKTEMDDAQKMASDYGCARDKYDVFRAQLLAKKDMFANQYQKAIDEISILKRIDISEVKSTAEFGAVVITQTHNLFISISIGKIEIEGKDFFAISSQVPLFKSLKGLKIGDTFTFNGNSNKIIEVF